MLKRKYGLKLANYGNLIIANKDKIKEEEKEVTIKAKVAKLENDDIEL